MNTTKKMPCGLSKSGKLTSHSEFVVPQITGDSPEGFCGIDSGKNYHEAAITYIGRDISVEDIISKIPMTHQTENMRSRIELFIGALNGFKIGNVIGIDYHSSSSFSLKLLRVSPRIRERKKLP